MCKMNIPFFGLGVGVGEGDDLPPFTGLAGREFLPPVPRFPGGVSLVPASSIKKNKNQ